jgi:hypothetical protein
MVHGLSAHILSPDRHFSERARIRPAVHQHILAGDIAGVLATQKGIHRAELGRCSKALRGYALSDKPFNRTSSSIDLSNRPRTPSEPWISRPCGRFTMKKRRKQNP